MTELKFTVDTNKIILSSNSIVFQTQNFMSQTKHFLQIDTLISKIAETIIKNIKVAKQIVSANDVDCLKISIKGMNECYLAKFGENISNLSHCDLVFFEMLTSDDDIKQNDQHISNFLKGNSKFEITVSQFKRLTRKQDFDKLYVISNNSGINLPRLDNEQKQIVETVDKNMLVQGVAGSGKTNICVEKIIFSACRNYSNKTLYTTFSRGLLNDIKLKIHNYIAELEDFIFYYDNYCVEFLDSNHKKAVENKYGIYFFSNDDSDILKKVNSVVDYLKNKVDFFLVQDLYKVATTKQPTIASQNYFINNYLQETKNHQIKTNLSKINVSHETIYKEIFGMIYGFCNKNNTDKIMSLQDYENLRENSFSKKECEIIYQIAKDYYKHLTENDLTDINLMCRTLLNSTNKFTTYALVIIDEVQDYSQVALNFFCKIAIKVFCVGDALQMINPSYFNFSYLKDLLYKDKFSEVKQLKFNYRNTKKIADIVSNLATINKQTFGVHNFVLTTHSLDTGKRTNAIYSNDGNFINLVSKSSFDNFTFVVDNQNSKSNLQKIIKNQEILTVSEIKGLERDTVVAYNLLSSNKDKWQKLEKLNIDKKNADENSIFRYYYNLFYVGISRAKNNLFVVENNEISQFKQFFSENFKILNAKDSILELNKIVSKIEFTDDEICERTDEFIKLEQFDNARFIAKKVKDDILQKKLLATIDINEKFIQYGKYRDAGIKFWELGYLEDAKKQFVLSNDTALCDLIDAVSTKNSSALNINIVDYYFDLIDNKVAKDFILQVMHNDLSQMKNNLSQTKKKFKEMKYGRK